MKRARFAKPMEKAMVPPEAFRDSNVRGLIATFISDGSSCTAGSCSKVVSNMMD